MQAPHGWFRRHRLAVVTTCVAVILAVALSAVMLSARGAENRVTIDEPLGLVGRLTSVSGTVHGFAAYNLWIDEQTDHGDRHHPTEEPCHRAGSHFDFGTVYLGDISDHGRPFHIRIVATLAGSHADRALMLYGRRAKDVANAYLGLEKLPHGARVVASVVVVRR